MRDSGFDCDSEGINEAGKDAQGWDIYMIF